jgi:hypothetical protein
MHCSTPQQIIMANYFKTILVDIFIVDENNPPQDYPTLNQLKNKFIIKVILVIKPKASRPKVIRKHQVEKDEKEIGKLDKF